MSLAPDTQTSSFDPLASAHIFGGGDSTPGFRDMLDGLPTAVYTTDAFGALTYFNPACIELSGRTPSLGIDHWCVTWKLYHADGTPMPHDQCPMAVTLNDGQIERGVEAIAERPDGSRIWFQPYPTALRDPAGKIIGGINVLVDITQRKRQEEALRHSQEKLQRVLETDAVAVLFFDHAGTLIDANDVFLRMTGYRREQIQRREMTWRTMTPPDWVDASEKQMAQFARTGRIGPYEKEYFLADGSRRWMMFAGRDLGDGTIAEFCVDITEAKRREADSRALAALGAQTITADHPQAIYEKIVAAAVSLMRSDFASMQLFHPDRGPAGELQLLAHHGFDPEGVKFWQWVSADSTCVCGLTLRARARVVIPDAALCDHLDDAQKTAYHAANIRAMQSTPLVSRTGKMLGMISTHWKHPHQPSESELSNFDILARQAADIIERSLTERAIRQNAAWLGAQKHALQAALSGAHLSESLDFLVKNVVEHFGNEPRAAFYMANPGGTALHHIVGMSPEYATAVDGFKIGADSFSCGLATHIGEPVLTADVRTEPRWRNWLPVADKHNFRACWSFPLHTSWNKFLGSFAVYWPMPREAMPADVAFASNVADTAAIIIARHAESQVRRHAEENLRRAKEEAEAANIAKDNFIASLSHELRTPLTPVFATLSVWENDAAAFPENLREDLSMLRRNVELEARLIDDLLDITRIARGKIALNFEVVDLQKLLDAVVEMYQSDIRAKKITFSWTTRPQNCFVSADPGRLQQVFWNVLKNAVKFTPEAGSIQVATSIDDRRRVQIAITDNGSGIGSEMLPRLFQPFEQETAGRYGGLGLGLAISKALVEAQDGAIEASSDGIGRGSRFLITLPCVDQPAAKDDTRLLPSTPGHEPAQPDHCYRVLLVEDHQDTARALSRLLRGNGHHVDMVHTIADALNALRHNSFAVLLSDIGLPDGTGMDLIRQVRHDLRLDLPAIALTGFGMEEDIQKTTAAGFSDHLTKPVNFAKLEEAIQRICATHNPATRSA